MLKKVQSFISKASFKLVSGKIATGTINIRLKLCCKVRDSQGGGRQGGYGGGGGYNQDSVAYGNQGQGGGSRSASAMEGPKENFDLDDDIPF